MVRITTGNSGATKSSLRFGANHVTVKPSTVLFHNLQIPVVIPPRSAGIALCIRMIGMAPSTMMFLQLEESVHRVETIGEAAIARITLLGRCPPRGPEVA